MAFGVSSPAVLDPITGIPVISVTLFVTQAGLFLSPQVTGFAQGSVNHTPGVAPPLPSGQSAGVPYGFLQVPTTGNLV